MYFIYLMKGMADYRYFMHFDCSMHRHIWVSFRELKYLCQWTPYRHIPQRWLTPGKHLHGTVHTAARATAASLQMLLIFGGPKVSAAVPAPVTVQLQIEGCCRGSSFQEQQPELSTSYRWATRPRGRGANTGRVAWKAFRWKPGWMVNFND